jgi:hypothetical protein
MSGREQFETGKADRSEFAYEFDLRRTTGRKNKV